MEDTDQKERAGAGKKRGVSRGVWMISLFFRYLYDMFLDELASDWKVFKKEARVFIGSALFIAGLVGFESGKYCDGNTADYLSCTRPSTYYYYDKVDVFLLIVGTFFILAWFLTPRGKGK